VALAEWPAADAIEDGDAAIYPAMPT